MEPKHPAKFSGPIIELVADILERGVEDGALILDPMGGVGTVHNLSRELQVTTIASELEFHWVKQGKGINVQADCLHLPFPAATFAAVVKSPDYGNRFADHHNARDGSTRRSYYHDYLGGTGQDLRPETSCKWAFSTPKYKAFHIQAHREVRRVLACGGIYVLNTSDYVSRKKLVRASEWHWKICQALGLRKVAEFKVGTQRLKMGENPERAEAEDVTVWMKVQPGLPGVEDKVAAWKMMERSL